MTDFSMDKWVRRYIESIEGLSPEELAPIAKGWFTTPDECRNRELALREIGNTRLMRVYSNLRYRLTVSKFEPKDDFEADCILRLVACEEIRADVLGRQSPLNRLRQSGRRNGWGEMIQRTVLKTSPDPSPGFKIMMDAGRLDLSFEAFVVANPSRFTTAAIDISKSRLARAGY
jgi:hypothetical protein